jgi:predicted nuclease of predicted toxin-antitoxin system
MAGMRILLDESLPRRLRQHFPADFLARTVQEQGWAGKRNGGLLQLAEHEFDVFITMDRGLEYQQSIAGFELAVVLLRAVSNRLSDLLPLVPELLETLKLIQPRQLCKVPAE